LNQQGWENVTKIYHMCILKKHKLELKVVSVNYVAFICKLRHFVTITLCI